MENTSNRPKTMTVILSVASFFIMLFILNLINSYEQTLIEAKNKHISTRTNPFLIDVSGLFIKTAQELSSKPLIPKE